MENLAKTYKGKVEFFKVSFDESQDLKESLGIRKIPTLIFYKNAKEVGERLVEPSSQKPIERRSKSVIVRGIIKGVIKEPYCKNKSSQNLFSPFFYKGANFK